eukprot:1142237-Pelagomonas_calceolata.AAC.1
MCFSDAPIPRSALSVKSMPHFLSTTSLSYTSTSPTLPPTWQDALSRHHSPCQFPGSFLKGKPGSVMEGIASRGVMVTLNSLVFGNSICALATGSTCNSSERPPVAMWEWPWRMTAAIAAYLAITLVLVIPAPFGWTSLGLSLSEWWNPAPITRLPWFGLVAVRGERGCWLWTMQLGYAVGQREEFRSPT